MPPYTGQITILFIVSVLVNSPVRGDLLEASLFRKTAAAETTIPGGTQLPGIIICIKCRIPTQRKD